MDCSDNPVVFLRILERSNFQVVEKMKSKKYKHKIVKVQCIDKFVDKFLVYSFVVLINLAVFIREVIS